MTEREAEWGDDERDDVFAYLHHEADLCPGCGEPLEESGHPDADKFLNPDWKWTYEVSNPIVCHACEAKDRKRNYFKKHSKFRDKVVMFVVRRKDREAA